MEKVSSKFNVMMLTAVVLAVLTLGGCNTTVAGTEQSLNTSDQYAYMNGDG